MSENVGYIGLWREIRSHWIWEEDRPRTRLEAWIDIICEVRFSDEPKKVIIKDQIIMCHYGESLNSLETWAKRWGWNKSKVRRFFQLLEKEQQIVTVNETVTTRLTVCNYEKFDPKKQKTDTASETQVKRKRNASETHLTPKEEREEGKEGNKKSDTSPKVYDIALEFYNHILATVKGTRIKLSDQNDAVDKLIRIDGFTEDEISKVVSFVKNDFFYSKNVRTLKKLREYWNTRQTTWFNAIREDMTKKNKSSVPLSTGDWYDDEQLFGISHGPKK